MGEGKIEMKILQTSYFKILLIIFLLLENLLCLAALPPTEPEEVGFSSERLERLSNVLNAYVEDEKLAGGVVLIARHGKVAYHEAFGIYRQRSSDTDAKRCDFSNCLSNKSNS